MLKKIGFLVLFSVTCSLVFASSSTTQSSSTSQSSISPVNKPSESFATPYRAQILIFNNCIHDYIEYHQQNYSSNLGCSHVDKTIPPGGTLDTYIKSGCKFRVIMRGDLLAKPSIAGGGRLYRFDYNMDKDSLRCIPTRNISSNK